MSSARILVVDDEADIRSLLEEILSEEGYTVVVAANAAEARELCQGCARPGAAGHLDARCRRHHAAA